MGDVTINIDGKKIDFTIVRIGLNDRSKDDKEYYHNPNEIKLLTKTDKLTVKQEQELIGIITSDKFADEIIYKLRGNAKEVQTTINIGYDDKGYLCISVALNTIDPDEPEAPPKPLPLNFRDIADVFNPFFIRA